MKKIRFIFLVLLTSIAVLSCNKTEEVVVPDTQNDMGDALPPEIAEIIFDTKSIPLKSSEIILPNGLSVEEFLIQTKQKFKNGRVEATKEMGPQEVRNYIIAKMAELAIKLDGKIPYGYGLRSYTSAGKPLGECNTDMSYIGLDCSGLMYQLFNHVGIELIKGTANEQRNVASIKNALIKAIPDWTTLTVEDKGQVPINDKNVETGDIIYWLNDIGKAFHIGIVLDMPAYGGKVLFQSNGSDTDCNKKKTRCGLCARNLRLGEAGVRALPLTQGRVNGFSTKYGVIRINAGISGKWDFNLKCQDANFNFLSQNLDFPIMQNNEFEIKVNNVAYQGDSKTYNLVFKFKYNKAINTLDCTLNTTSPLAAPNFFRNDSFSIELKTDITKPQNATLGDNRDAGCDYEVQFINKTKINVEKLKL